MKNKKGFTLVELVIVIAVIAILAGVMIGTFASVVKKAKESAKMQEMANQKQQQMIDDIDAKLKDDAWLGWEDFEEKLADAVSKAVSTSEGKTLTAEQMKTATSEAVEAAFAKYAASSAAGGTSLTEEQVKYIVESALAKSSYSGVTEGQIKTIVNNAVTGVSTLTKSQVAQLVQSIVDASNSDRLTLAQVTKVVDEAVSKNKVDDATIKAAVANALKDYKSSTLTSEEISALLAKYITDGNAKGDYTWYDAKSTTLTISGENAAEQLVALSTIAKSGTSFAGKTVTIAANADLTTADFDPIIDFDGTLKADKGVKVTLDMTPVWNTLDDRNGKTMMNYMAEYQENNKTVHRQKDAVAYGLVASLKEGGVVENIDLVLKVDFSDADPGSQYTYFGGLVGFLDGGIIKNCTVTGSIKGFNRIGGVVGWARKGTIENVTVSDLAIETDGTKKGDAAIAARYTANSAFAAYVSGGEVTFKNCKVDGTFNSTIKTASNEAPKVGYFVGQYNNAKEGEFTDATKITLDGCKLASTLGTLTTESAYGISSKNISDSNENTTAPTVVKAFGGGLQQDKVTIVVK